MTEDARATPRRRHRGVRRVVLALTAAAVLAGPQLVASTAPDPVVPDGCAGRVDASAPGGSWVSRYCEDFTTAVSLGGFTNRQPDDWYLASTNPYARSLRSYPDGWPTTDRLSLNMASRTTSVLASADGAVGVFRLHGHSETVDGVVQALAGSFFPVIAPHAPTGVEQVSQTYGRYTVRFRTSGGYPPGASSLLPPGTRVPRYGTAFLLWPADDDWHRGEVNFPEMSWESRIRGFVHEIGNRPEVNASSVTTDEPSNDWNTATIAWSPGLLVFSLNGVEVFRTTTNVPSVPMRWGFQSGGQKGVPDPDVSGDLLIDFVRIEAYRPGVPAGG